ncbi:MAG: NAD-binding protein [Natronomonas sp.]|nr:NAD-binding protein [Natronomonas sp.]
MKFAIVGYGRVGARTADILSAEGHEVIVVETDETKAQRAVDEGHTVVRGSGEDERVLERIGLDDTDAIAALTSDLNVNFTACMIAAGHDCRTVGPWRPSHTATVSAPRPTATGESANSGYHHTATSAREGSLWA